jgi:fructoselysine-6-P-deglycase FrlB-like protein
MLPSRSQVPGELTIKAIQAQPEWLRGVPERIGDRRFPDGRVVFTGCGTSFHAAQTGGEAHQALEAVLRPPEADLLVCVSHEGATPLTLEAAQAFGGPVWLVTGKPDGPIADVSEEVIVVTPEVEDSYCHTGSYTCAVAALDALHGADVRWLRLAVEHALADPFEGGDWERVAVVGAGRDWPTAQEAVLKLREGAHIPAEAHQTEQILHGHLAASGCRSLSSRGRGEQPSGPQTSCARWARSAPRPRSCRRLIRWWTSSASSS